MSQGVVAHSSHQSQLVIPIEMERTQRQSKSFPSRRKGHTLYTRRNQKTKRKKRNTRKGVEERKNA